MRRADTPEQREIARQNKLSKRLSCPGRSVYSPGRIVYKPKIMGRPVSPWASVSCPRCGGENECELCETYRCGHCKRWHSWEYGGSESVLCDLCWSRRRRARRAAARRLVQLVRLRHVTRRVKRKRRKKR